MPPAPANPRKRPAPGASPAIPPTTMTQPSFQFPPGSPQLTNDQFLRWGQNALNNATGVAHSDPAMDYSANAYGGFNSNVLQGSPSPNIQQQHGHSTQLARRPANQQQLVARGPRMPADGDDGWLEYADGLQLDAQVENGNANNDDDIETLERRAAIAKREAQAKRKQIPPFVQKLSSFLDESRNTDLIRWSDDGNSFIVLDEDEFARTLIPELFKHSNYASFVRQLNMYGFHKKVGLSDNSMRASERRNKSPSEYVNQYFKRGHPNLLWLINKPKNPNPSSKGNKEPKGGDDGVLGQISGRDASVGPGEGYTGDGSGEGARQMLATGQNLAEVRQQLEAIQAQQRIISSAISRLRKDHNQIYEQAAAFQALHDRHESSINAILTFLATVYNRSLEGHGGQTLAHLIANSVPQDPQGQRGVTDVAHVGGNNMNQGQRSMKRQRLLLGAPPPAAGHDGHSGRATTVTPAVTPGSAAASPMAGGQDGQLGGGSPLFDSTHPTTHNQAEIGDPDIISMLNTVRSTDRSDEGQGPPRLDFSAALTQYHNSNGNSPLLTTQRNNLLQHMMTQEGGNQSALIPSNVARIQDLTNRLSSSREELDLLQRLQAEQDSKVQQLTSMVSPLSPTGSIPGLADGGDLGAVGEVGSPYQGINPNPFDLDQIFNSGDYFSGSNTGGNPDQNVDSLVNFDNNNTVNTSASSNSAFDFPNFDESIKVNDEDGFFGGHPQDEHLHGLRTDQPTGGGRIVATSVNSNSSEGASPATTNTTNTVHTASVVDEESEEQMMGMGGVVGSPSKRRRRM